MSYGNGGAKCDTISQNLDWVGNFDDRNRAQAKFQVEIDVLRNFTVTPTVNWRDDEFLLSQNQLGLTHDRSTAAGIETAYAATPDLRFLFSYMNEQRGQHQIASSTVSLPLCDE